MSGEPEVSDRKENSTSILVGWLAIFLLGAGLVIIVLIVHIRRKSDGWLFDLPLLVSCLLYARSYALRLLKKG